MDKNIREKLADSYGISRESEVLEIGAGTGDLTLLIAQKSGRVCALELDRNLCAILKQRVKGAANITVINGDILKFSLRRHFSPRNKIKVVGNIPYYITTPIIERLLRYKDGISDIFITVQKEYAQRVITGPGSKLYGSFSCFVQYHCLPRILFGIKRTCFYPAPKVDSCLLYLKIRPEPAVKAGDEKLLFRIIRTAFNQRRKTLKNSLRRLVPEGRLSLFFAESRLDPNIRPERLRLEDFASLANSLK